MSNDISPNDPRLLRIEDKIDKLSEALIQIARAEEKLVAIEQKYAAQYDRMNNFSRKLDNIESKVEDNNRTVIVINKLFWAVILAVVTGIAAQYFFK
jgi:flagellin-like hook-associated protein FlgL